MYEEQFGLDFEPFSLSPDPAFLYLGEAHREALAALRIGLEGRRGLMLMVGEVGTGKTTLLYSLLPQLGAKMKVAYVSNTKLGFDDLLRQALNDFGIAVTPGTRFQLLSVLREALFRWAEQEITAALVIDEAQNLDDDLFENLRLLSNVEKFDSKLLQIVLVGQPELLAKISRPNLRQLAERVAIYSEVKRLSWRESHSYVRHRLAQAGGTAEIFTRPALALLLWRARGIPRRINILCHNAMLFAYGRQSPRVSWRVARRAVHAGRWQRRPFKRTKAVQLRRARLPDHAKQATKPEKVQRASPRARRWVALLTWVPVVVLWAITAGLWWHLRTPELQMGVESSLQAADEPLLAGRVGVASPTPAGPEPRPTPVEDSRIATTVEQPSVIEQQPDDHPVGPRPNDDRQPRLQAEPAANRSSDLPFRVIQVAPGATLQKLTREVYGRVDHNLIALVCNRNQISDPDRIMVDSTLVFPPAWLSESSAEPHARR